MPPVIVTDDLCRSFGSQPAVRDLSLRIDQGEIYGFIGPNGAGKTTTLRMLAGVLAATSGRVEVLGIDVGSVPERVKAEIGYLPQGEVSYGDLTVSENVRFLMDLYGVPSKMQEGLLGETLELLGLRPLAERRAATLSGGQRRLLALACAIAPRHRLVILDEPTAGLDPHTRGTVWAAIHRLRAAGTTVFVTTHGMDEADRCLRVGLMGGGRLLAEGTPEELRAGFGESVYEVSGGAQPLPEDLPAIPGVVQAAARGSRLRLIVEAGRDPRPEIEALGLQAKRIEPDLEDVFMELTRGVR